MSYIEWIRSKVGHQKIFLVFATVIVLDENGRILVQQRSDFDFAGLPGGVMELNEDIQTTARREVLEETGYRLGELSLVGVYTDPRYDVTYPNGDEVQQFTVCFSSIIASGNGQPDGTEILSHQFVSLQDIFTRSWPTWYLDMLNDFQKSDLPAFQQNNSRSHCVDQISSIRPLIGTQKLIAVGGSAIIRNSEGAVLMIQRADNGAWIFPAGYSDLGENVAQTTVREVKEETNLDVIPKRIIGIFTDPLFHHTYPNGDIVQNVGVLFECKMTSFDIQLQESELRDYQWVLPSDLIDKIVPKYKTYGLKIIEKLNEGYFVF